MSEKIFDRLEHDYDFVKRLGYNVLGVYLVGSQNYGLNYANSDIDTKVVVIPTLKEIATLQEPTSTLYTLPSKEQIEVKDVRLMHNCYLKQNVNFVETLFTNYKLLNPKFLDVYQPVFDNAEMIARYNEVKTVCSMFGQLRSKHKKIQKELEEKGADTKDYDFKAVAQAYRFIYFLNKYMDNCDYNDCIIPDKFNRKNIVNLKSTNPPIKTLGEAFVLVDKIVESLDRDIKLYLLEKEESGYIPNKKVEKLLEKVSLDILKKSIGEEING